MINRLKNIQLLRYLNSKYKTYLLKKQYRVIQKYYSGKIAQKSFNELLKEKGWTRLRSHKDEENRPVILYIGVDELQDKSGFLQALNKFANVLEFTRKDGKYGQYNYQFEDRANLNANRITELVKDQKIDILMMQTWADNINIETLKELKKREKFKVINIGMDDRHTFLRTYSKKKGITGTKGLIPILDLALTTSQECVEWYIKEGIPSLYFPLGSSTDFFDNLNLPKKHDVGFIGAKYGIRAEIISALKSNGINVTCYGTGWNNGRLPLNKTNEFFNECKIILGVGTIGYSRDFYALKLRDFDAPLSGSCYVTHANEDLKSLFQENEEIILCKNTNEFVHQITHLLKNPENLSKISQKGYMKVKLNYTYEKQIQNLFKILDSPQYSKI